MSKKQHLQGDDSFVGKIVAAFLEGNLSVLLILVMLACGAAALILTPREEEPQIVVPLADIHIQMPGSSAEEVERLVSSKLERLLSQIDGVEYVYSMSRPGNSVVTVRFYVGESRELSLVKLHNKIMMNADVVPPGVTGWVVKPIEIDDVPLVNIALWSEKADDFALRRVAEEVEIAMQSVPDTARTEIAGGRKRQIRIVLEPEKMTSRQVAILDVDRILRGANINLHAGTLKSDNREILVESGPFIQGIRELGNLVVGVFAGKPVDRKSVV